MSGAGGVSLLGYVKTPVLVGDPDGFVVYANEAFITAFCAFEEDPVGEPLASVFGGGAREVVLSATADVLGRGQTARLQLREGGRGFVGLASPIEAEDDRVGVVMVLLEERSNVDQLAAQADEVSDPMTDAVSQFRRLAQSAGGKLSRDQQSLLDNGLAALEEAQVALRELNLVIHGGKPKQGHFDVSDVILRVAERIQGEAGDDLDLQLLVSPNLPRVVGTSPAFERLLSELVRGRQETAQEGQPLTLMARAIGRGKGEGVLVSLVDVPDGVQREATGLPPEALSEGIAAMSGETICVEDSRMGRVTSIRLTLADG